MNKLRAEQYADMILDQWVETPRGNRSEIIRALEGVDVTKGEELLASLEALPKSWRIGAKDIEAKAGMLRDREGGVSFAVQHFICQVCARGFDFCYAPESDGPFKKVFPFCPECGFVPMVRLKQDGGRIFYRGDEERFDLFKLHHGREYAEIKARRGFFNSEKDRASEFEAQRIKGLLPNKTYEEARG